MGDLNFLNNFGHPDVDSVMSGAIKGYNATDVFSCR